MKAINLGFSHGSADAQNRFGQREREEKYHWLQGINVLPIASNNAKVPRTTNTLKLGDTFLY